MKGSSKSFFLAAAILVSAAGSPLFAADVTVEAGGEKFFIRERDGRIFRLVDGRQQRVLLRTLRVKSPEVSGQANPDGRGAKLTVKEIFPSFTIVRGEYSLSAAR